MSQSLTERDNEQIAGVLFCYDRLVMTGTLPGICYADGMTRFLHASGIRIFDYQQSARLADDEDPAGIPPNGSARQMRLRY